MKKIAFLIILTLIMGLLVTGCSRKENPLPSTAKFSVNGGTTSHNNGQICLSCHIAGGAAELALIVAGSVYKTDLITPAPNGSIAFWSGIGGTGDLVAVLQIDAKGNFFTNASILPGLGAYPQLIGSSGDIRNMPMMVTDGNCNSCHGVTEDPIWIN